jgi:hypothetical protein
MNHFETAVITKYKQHNKLFWEDIKRNIDDPFLGALAKLWKATIFIMSAYLSFCLSVRLSAVRIEQLSSRSKGFHKIWYWVFFENLWRKFKFR